MKKCLFVGCWLLLAASGEAFPTWMGVYGTIPRHNGVNPGQFTILMNEDYFGLQANVGIRVNGGDWQESAMSYQTNVNGNSVWAYVPPEPFRHAAGREAPEAASVVGAEIAHAAEPDGASGVAFRVVEAHGLSGEVDRRNRGERAAPGVEGVDAVGEGDGHPA